MSAPQTNIEKQKRRHKAPLIGVALALVFAFGMFVLWVFDVFDGATPADNVEPEIPAENLQETVPGDADADSDTTGGD